jgi:hypothetical protein
VRRPRRTPAEIEKARKEAAKKEKGCLFWLPSRIEGPDTEPRLSDDPFEGNVAQLEFPRILRDGKMFRVRGQVRIGELDGDKDLAAYLIMRPGRLRHDREEIIAKKLFSEDDFKAMDAGKLPKGVKSPRMRIGDIDHMTDLEADDFCKLHGIMLPAGADLLVKRAQIKKKFSTTR